MTLALIPEAIAFSTNSGVDPKVGLYASFCSCTVIAFVGGRPAMISAATGAMALLMVYLARDHDLDQHMQQELHPQSEALPAVDKHCDGDHCCHRGCYTTSPMA